MLVIAGGYVLMVNVSLEVTTPAVATTVMVSLPAAVTGTFAVICVSESTVNDKFMPFHVTCVALERYVPVIVIWLPGSPAAVTEVIVGAPTVNAFAVVATP